MRTGVNASYSYGPEGQRVKFILLDTRSHMNCFDEGEGVLGSGQWAWLEEELRSSDAQINFIGSGIQGM